MALSFQPLYIVPLPKRKKSFLEVTNIKCLPIFCLMIEEQLKLAEHVFQLVKINERRIPIPFTKNSFPQGFSPAFKLKCCNKLKYKPVNIFSPGSIRQQQWDSLENKITYARKSWLVLALVRPPSIFRLIFLQQCMDC